MAPYYGGQPGWAAGAQLVEVDAERVNIQTRVDVVRVIRHLRRDRRQRVGDDPAVASCPLAEKPVPFQAQLERTVPFPIFY
jgi:hypothetical protein